jgi:hypothetical protein
MARTVTKEGKGFRCKMPKLMRRFHETDSRKRFTLPSGGNRPKVE